MNMGEPGLSAFLRSVLQNLGDIGRVKPNSTTYLCYDPELEKLKEKLIFFQALVVDGEAKRLHLSGVDEWMDDLTDLLYDVEDILDDIRILWKANSDQVRFHQLNFSQDLKKCFRKILAGTELLRDRAKDLDLKRNTLSEESKITLRTRETRSMVDISEIHGREDDRTKIVKRLLEVDGVKGKKKYDVVCIVGMGGIGKTTLAQLVFNDREVVKHFNVKSWVCISTVFDVARATKDLIENSGGGGGGGGRLRDLSLGRLQRLLNEMVRNRRFLFVLDDVWSSSEWDIMKTPFNSCANGSKILVTTRKMQLAHNLGNKDPYLLRQLNFEQCMEVFRDRGFGDDEEEHEKLIIGEKIVRACQGVPLAVKVIGSMLQFADIEKWRAVSENSADWANINDEIHPAIRFSYYDLPASLKRCFEYLAIFPPDFTFVQDDVVRLWIADGLVQEVDGWMAEDIGNEYYNELMARSLIQTNNTMHDIVHHLATLLSTKFCYKKNSKEPPSSVRHAFVVNLNHEIQYELLTQAPSLRTLIVNEVKDDYRLQITIKYCELLRALKIGYNYFNQPTLSLGESFMNHLRHIRYITIIDSDIKHLPDSLCMLDKLQFLDLHGNKDLENLPERMDNLSNLRCLILRDSSISSLPESICALSQLQVLDLTNCGRLKQLPTDIGNLRSLRTLHLRNTSISSLPDSIYALCQLQVLNLKDCRNLKELPKDVGDLRTLRTLDLRGTKIASQINLLSL